MRQKHVFRHQRRVDEGIAAGREAANDRKAASPLDACREFRFVQLSLHVCCGQGKGAVARSAIFSMTAAAACSLVC